MQIVIDISKEEYEDIKYFGTIVDESRDYIASSILNGTPLEDIKTEIPILSHWQTDDGQDLLMVADALVWHNGYTWYEKDELIKTFEDLGMIEEGSTYDTTDRQHQSD